MNTVKNSDTNGEMTRNRTVINAKMFKELSRNKWIILIKDDVGGNIVLGFKLLGNGVLIYKKYTK